MNYMFIIRGDNMKKNNLSKVLKKIYKLLYKKKKTHAGSGIKKCVDFSSTHFLYKLI